MKKKSIIIIGMGEMAGVFARGFLRCGFPVTPVTRQMDSQQVASEIPDPELVLVAVAEKDVQAVLSNIPQQWQESLVLLQNELLPNDWLQHQLNPTVISVWFEKKKGQDYKVLIASPAYGDKANILVDTLASIDISARELQSADELLFELVVKNVYILTTNIAGLKVGGTVSELWKNHEALTRSVAGEIIELQKKLSTQSFDTEKLIDAMLFAFDGDPDHNCMGRSAPDRLKRALQLAEKHQLNLTTLNDIASECLL
ncbi:MAG: hypothetical protein DIZ80_15475 [endosymbiont of Galathealinum brachiosum]|uniref:Uncharacterized protein n=1 Tax=endosymbiont of Galathealinum brachiosum TaxID=2200906 RepID=A0A370D9C3_9GAMM|nr:MAG: hypothetical protein DIZ80_15475 [endosymbiont of Galathealinum brachiosum]